MLTLTNKKIQELFFSCSNVIMFLCIDLSKVVIWQCGSIFFEYFIKEMRELKIGRDICCLLKCETTTRNVKISTLLLRCFISLSCRRLRGIHLGRADAFLSASGTMFLNPTVSS